MQMSRRLAQAGTVHDQLGLNCRPTVNDLVPDMGDGRRKGDGEEYCSRSSGEPLLTLVTSQPDK